VTTNTVVERPLGGGLPGSTLGAVLLHGSACGWSRDRRGCLAPGSTVGVHPRGAPLPHAIAAPRGKRLFPARSQFVGGCE